VRHEKNIEKCDTRWRTEKNAMHEREQNIAVTKTDTIQDMDENEGGM
jgi:hypothetical protein